MNAFWSASCTLRACPQSAVRHGNSHMLTEYEATVLTKRRQEVGRKQLPDGQMSVAHIERAMQQAHKLRSSHLRALLREHSSKRLGVVLVVLCILSAASLVYSAVARPTVDAQKPHPIQQALVCPYGSMPRGGRPTSREAVWTPQERQNLLRRRANKNSPMASPPTSKDPALG